LKSEKAARAAYLALKPEEETQLKRRGEFKVHPPRADGNLFIEISAHDFTSLRALTNSILRWIASVQNVLRELEE